MARSRWKAVVAGVCMLAGCAQNRPIDPNGGSPVDHTGPLPGASDVIARYNARVARLGAVESPIDLVVTGEDENGKPTRNQGEGNLKMVRPMKVALRIDKVGQTVFWLGSNDERYWWFDLGGDQKVALVGTHAKATPEGVSRFGLPVHPADLLDLAGVAPLEMSGDVKIRWASGPGVVLEMPGRWGKKRLTIDPATGEATRVEILDSGGVVVASSRLEKYQRVPVRGDAASEARMATLLRADIPPARASVELVIHSPANNGESRIKPANFNYDDLRARMGIEREVDLDKAPSGSAERGGP